MNSDRDAPKAVEENAEVGSPDVNEAEESRRSLLGKISRFSVYMPPALLATLTVAAPIPSGSL